MKQSYFNFQENIPLIPTIKAPPHKKKENESPIYIFLFNLVSIKPFLI